MKNTLPYLVLLNFIFYGGFLNAQKQDHIWISNFTSVDSCENSVWPEICGASVLDFNVLPPKAYLEDKLTLDFLESNASICDDNGELLLYSNGQSIHDFNHHWIENGEVINYSPKWEWLTWTNEFNKTRPTGFRGVQATGFIPVPEREEEFWCLYINYENFDGPTEVGFYELWSSYIKKNEEGNFETYGLDSLIQNRIRRRGNLNACKHANGRDWWFLQFNRDSVYTYLVNQDGIHLDHIQILPFELRTSFGQAKFSPTGSKFALHGAYVFEHNEPHGADFMLADFDRCTGDLLNAEYHQIQASNWIDNALEFSPDEKLLYLGLNDTIYQYDLESDNLLDSKEIIYFIQGDSCTHITGDLIQLGQMQLGPDNKIYCATGGNCTFMHRIEYPNEKGSGCMFTLNAIDFPSFIFGTIPTLNTYRLGPLDGSSCDTLNIDNLPISRYWYEQDSVDFQSVQFWDVSYFRPEEWSWNFGDGMESNERHPFHEFENNGIYEVCFTVRNENAENTSCQTLEIGPSSITKILDKEYLSIYPNPIEEYTRLVIYHYLPENARFKIYNSEGILVKSFHVYAGENRLYLGDLNEGIYLYEVVDGTQRVGTGKLLKT